MLRIVHQHGDPAHPVGLLRARSERPRGGSAADKRDEIAPFHCSNASRASHGKDSTVGRETAALLYLGNDFELASFCIVSGPALHLDNTFLENDYPQLLAFRRSSLGPRFNAARLSDFSIWVPAHTGGRNGRGRWAGTGTPNWMCRQQSRQSFRHTLANAIFLTPLTLLAVPMFEFFNDVLHWRAHGHCWVAE
jgi:hypothetical protein